MRTHPVFAISQGPLSTSIPFNWVSRPDGRVRVENTEVHFLESAVATRPVINQHSYRFTSLSFYFRAFYLLEYFSTVNTFRSIKLDCRAQLFYQFFIPTNLFRKPKNNQKLISTFCDYRNRSGENA